MMGVCILWPVLSIHVGDVRICAGMRTLVATMQVTSSNGCVGAGCAYKQTLTGCAAATAGVW